MRSWRFWSDSRRTVAVMSCRGRRTRPATTHPRPTDATAITPGGVGIANVMVISVLERRREIGLRRAVGATRRHVALQFLTESLILSGLGGLAGVTLGTLVTLAYTASRGWTTVVPAMGLLGGVVAALAIGALAGLYPATRAARLAPTDALRTT